MSVSSRLTRKLHQILGEDAKEMVELMQQEDSHRRELRETLIRMEGRLTGIELKIAGVETLVERRSADLIKWSFVFWVGAVAAIAMLAGVLP